MTNITTVTLEEVDLFRSGYWIGTANEALLEIEYEHSGDYVIQSISIVGKHPNGARAVFQLGDMSRELSDRVDFRSIRDGILDCKHFRSAIEIAIDEHAEDAYFSRAATAADRRNEIAASA